MDLIFLKVCCRSQVFFVEVNSNEGCILNDLSDFLWIQLFLDHDCHYLPDNLVNDTFSGLWYTQMIADWLLSEFLD